MYYGVASKLVSRILYSFSLNLAFVSRFRQKCQPLKEMLFELGRVFVCTQEIITWARLESQCPLVASERDFVEGHLAVTTDSQIGKPGQYMLSTEVSFGYSWFIPEMP